MGGWVRERSGEGGGKWIARTPQAHGQESSRKKRAMVKSRLYEQLKQQIARDFNMKVTVSRTEVGGYCADCLGKLNS